MKFIRQPQLAVPIQVLRDGSILAGLLDGKEGESLVSAKEPTTVDDGLTTLGLADSLKVSNQVIHSNSVFHTHNVAHYAGLSSWTTGRLEVGGSSTLGMYGPSQASWAFGSKGLGSALGCLA